MRRKIGGCGVCPVPHGAGGLRPPDLRAENDDILARRCIVRPGTGDQIDLCPQKPDGTKRQQQTQRPPQMAGKPGLCRGKVSKRTVRRPDQDAKDDAVRKIITGCADKPQNKGQCQPEGKQHALLFCHHWEGSPQRQV